MVSVGNRMWNPMFSPNCARARDRTSVSMAALSYGNVQGAARMASKQASAFLAVVLCTGGALANQHPHPHPGSLEYLDRNSYARNMRVLGVFQLGEERGHKLQMMAIGARRYIL